MRISNIDYVPGYEIAKDLGLVRANVVRAKHVGKDIIAGLKNVVGGEIKEYTESLNEAREEAIKRMIRDADRLKANAIVDVRFTTSQVMAGAAELLVYGTAVRLI